jgi:hypothetical protein
VAKFRPRRKTPPTLPEKAHYSISLVLKTSIWRCLPGGTHVEGWELGSTLVREPKLVTTHWLKTGFCTFNLLWWKWPPRIT